MGGTKGFRERGLHHKNGKIGRLHSSCSCFCFFFWVEALLGCFVFVPLAFFGGGGRGGSFIYTWTAYNGITPVVLITALHETGGECDGVVAGWMDTWDAWMDGWMDEIYENIISMTCRFQCGTQYSNILYCCDISIQYKKCDILSI